MHTKHIVAFLSMCSKVVVDDAVPTAVQTAVQIAVQIPSVEIASV